MMPPASLQKTDNVALVIFYNLCSSKQVGNRGVFLGNKVINGSRSKEEEQNCRSLSLLSEDVPA